eukprot:5611023-Pyramimonas_sp.AAC.1
MADSVKFTAVISWAATEREPPAARRLISSIHSMGRQTGASSTAFSNAHEVSRLTTPVAQECVLAR